MHSCFQCDAEPGRIFLKSGDAIAIRCINGGAVWVTQLRKPKTKENPCPFKVPASVLLGSVLKDVAEDPNVFQQIHWQDKGSYGILHFDFYNGAMGTHHCKNLAAAIETVGRHDWRFIILAGSPRNWSNGINLNMIEHASNPEVEAWNNIIEINNVVKAIINQSEAIVVSAVQANAGGGGVYMALAADFVFLKPGEPDFFLYRQNQAFFRDCSVSLGTL